MKKLITILVFLLLFSANTCQHTVIHTTPGGVMISYDDTLNSRQLDSLFAEEEISPNIESDWIMSRAVSDKQEMLYKYVYIKELTDSTGVLYTLHIYNDTLFIINKRIMQ